VVVHRDDVGGVDDLEVRALRRAGLGQGLADVVRAPDEQDRRALRSRSDRSRDDVGGCIVPAHRINRDSHTPLAARRINGDDGSFGAQPRSL
jgi:hypothetical protein